MQDAIILLAGGKATRLPGKLEREVNGLPLLARVYENVRAIAPVYVAGWGSYTEKLDAMIECPVVIDRWPHRGPLSGILSACDHVNAVRIYAIAGDAPGITAETLITLADAWKQGDEAVVPVHGQRVEPLAALYAREALMREAPAVLASDDASMHALLARLQVRHVPMSSAPFLNINTIEDLP